MTTPPPGPPPPGPPPRPGQPDWRGRGTTPPDPATRRLQRQGPPPEPPTRQFRAPRPPEPATEKLSRQAPPPPPRAPAPPRPPTPPPVPDRQPVVADEPPRPRFLNRRTIPLLLLIVVALIAGGLAGGELYARNRADGILVAVAECVVKDDATISFGVNPPFLWQHVTGHYTNISVETAGTRVQDADGMTAEVTLKDVRLQGTADSKGTIGSLDATLTWKSAGIKDTVAANLPDVGKLITGVTTNPADGTLVLEAGDNSVTAKPVVTDGDLNLEVVAITNPDLKDFIQTKLNDLTKRLNDNYPLGIHADSVEVTATGVVGKFSSQDASIPNEAANPCFKGL